MLCSNVLSYLQVEVTKMFSTGQKISGHTKFWTSLYLVFAISMGLVACGGGGGGDSASTTLIGSETAATEVATVEAAATAAAAEDAKIMKDLESTEAMSAEESDKACKDRNNNTFKKLLTCVTLDGVRTHQAKLRDIAIANGGTRVAGTKGFDESADYAEKVFKDAGYNVTRQVFPFKSFIELPGSSLTQVSPTPTAVIESNVLSYSGSGKVTATVSALSSVLGCSSADFAGFPAGNIALISRGSCTFAIKANNAQAAGASAVVIYNNVPGEVGGTLGDSFTQTIAVTSVFQTVGQQFSTIPNLQLSINVSTVRGTSTSTNIIAESKEGDANNVVMVGAHLDSVNDGPGIQDNGTGSAAILEVAKQMGKVKTRNKVRFVLWSAEESGLLGSTYYVNGLSDPEKEKIALYLNFDMIGSPNHVFFIYDGDNSDGVGAGAGPAGSAGIEGVFQTFYNKAGVSFKGTDFDGRSDYGPFIKAGIPSGGLFTGAEGTKTVAEAEVWGGIVGTAYDPCYHKACDNYGNINLYAFDLNSDAVAYATLQFAMTTKVVNGIKGQNVSGQQKQKRGESTMSPPMPDFKHHHEHVAQ
jgi:Zn-dependent M28 family amino/carboxypeptidase